MYDIYDLALALPLLLLLMYTTCDRSALEYTRATMPENNPGYLTDQQYADIIAYMLAVSGIPAGDAPLRVDPDVLADLLIGRRP